MFGVFGIGLATTVTLCILAIVLGLFIAMLGAAIFYPDDDTFNIGLIGLVGLVIGAIGCAIVIAQPDGYVGEAKYVENAMNYEEGSGMAVPIVEVEGKGRFPVDGSGIVSYEIGDMVPVECYGNYCDVKVVSP